MSVEGIAFPVLVGGGLTIFGLTLGVVAWWSERTPAPRRVECRTADRPAAPGALAKAH